MNHCPNCKKKIKKNATFCDKCGTKIQTIQFCPQCGMQVDEGFAVCANCGTVISGRNTKHRTKSAKKKGAVIGILAGCAVLVALLTLFIGLWLSRKETKMTYNMAIYIKDRELFLTNLKHSAEEPWQLTSRYCKSEELTDAELSWDNYSMGETIMFSEDGRRIFFPDDTADVSGYTLYYRDTDQSEKDAIKIDSGLEYHSVNRKGTIVTYLKQEDRSLYQYNIQSGLKEKIDEHIIGYCVSDDGLKLGYMNNEGGLYLKYSGQNKEKIASDVSHLEYLSDDFKTVYYVRDHNLYKYEEGKERVKISTNVHDVIAAYNSGEMYYVKNETETLPLMDYILDDLKKTDAAMERPSAPETPSSEDYTSFDEWDLAWEYYYKEYDLYLDALQQYTKKEERDALRNELSNRTIESGYNSLYYFDGKKEHLITDWYVQYSASASNRDLVVSYEVFYKDDYDPIKISEIYDVSMAEADVQRAMNVAVKTYFAARNKSIVQIEHKVESVYFDNSGAVAFYTESNDEENYGDLYKIQIKDAVIGTPELYDTDVEKFYYCDQSHYIYYKNFDENYNGDLYINGEKIDSSVMVWYVEYSEDTNEWFYLTDFDNEIECGTLKKYSDGKSMKITDDVHDFYVYPDARVLYLYDYSVNYCKGELRMWHNGESKRIDDDVLCIVPVYGDYQDSDYDAFGW